MPNERFADVDAPSSEPSDAGAGHIHISAQPDDAWQRHTVGFRYDSPEGWTASGTVTRTRRRGVIITAIAFEGSAEDEGAPGAVTASALRQLPTGDILASAMRSDLLPPYEHEQPPPKREPRPSGRAPLTEELIRDVAETYLRESAPGKPRGALQRLSEHFDKPVPTISRWVQRARADGWLGPAIPGREGGEPGPRMRIAEDEGFIPSKAYSRQRSLEAWRIVRNAPGDRPAD